MTEAITSGRGTASDGQDAKREYEEYVKLVYELSKRYVCGRSGPRGRPVR